MRLSLDKRKRVNVLLEELEEEDDLDEDDDSWIDEEE